MIKTISKEDIWDLLKGIPDPEIPVISITDLGILRDVEIKEDKIIVSITPTYSGCPAMKAIGNDIISTLNEKGFQNVEVKLVTHLCGRQTGLMKMQSRD